jgi:FixJ family two-component response regulator
MIAVVDDDESVCKALVRLLRSRGFSSRGFASGGALLEAWLIEPADCLVLDLQLPRLSGLEVQRYLRRAGSRVPTILITASDEPYSRDECAEEGASVWLRKPLDEGLLFGALERAQIRPDRSGQGSVPPR